MSQNLVKCMGKLQMIANVQSKTLRSRLLADFFDDCLYHAIKEIVLNLVNKNLPLSEQNKQFLKKHKKPILTLANNRSKNKRKQLVIQSGGYLQILVPVVASLLANLM